MALGFNPAPGGKERTMSAVIIEHVNVSDLPETWRAKLPKPAAAQVTVRIEAEANTSGSGWPAGLFARISGGWSGPALTRAPQGEFEIRKALD